MGIRFYEYITVAGKVYFRLGQSEVFCTSHARDRLQERDITVAEVLDTVNSSDRIKPYVSRHGLNATQFIKKVADKRVINVTIFRIEGRVIISTVYIKSR